MKIVVDAGHGINTSGKRSPKGEREWKFNDTYMKGFIAQIKTYEGVTVVRADDPTGKTDVSLANRVAVSNNGKADLHISFHCNANSGSWGKWTGTEVHVYQKCTNTSEAYKLASAVAPVLANAMGLKDRGVKKTNLYITRQTKCTAILIENGFMDSKIDIVALRDTTKMYNAGVKIADAVAKFYKLKKKAVKKPATTTTTTKPTTTTTTTKPTTTATGTTYTVKSGDTLYSISKKYNLTVAKLKSLNGLKTDVLQIGQKLIVSEVTYHTIKSGDTLYALSKKYGVTVSQIKEWNGLKSDTLTIGKTLIVKK